MACLLFRNPLGRRKASAIPPKLVHGTLAIALVELDWARGVEQNRRRESFSERIQRCFLDAVIQGQSGDHKLPHPPPPQELLQPGLADFAADGISKRERRVSVLAAHALSNRLARHSEH